jgi:hypothetical protein
MYTKKRKKREASEARHPECLKKRYTPFYTPFGGVKGYMKGYMKGYIALMHRFYWRVQELL